MTCYDIVVKLAQKKYKKIYINLITKSLKIGKQKIIENGVVIKNEIKIGDDVFFFTNLIDKEYDLNELYKKYKYSIPSEDDNKIGYFKALTPENLTDKQLIFGEQRFEAKIKLELYILLGTINGILKWKEDDKWFVTGEDKDFIILKQYI